MNNLLTIIAGGILISFIIALLMTVPTWLLWNWLMPVIFGLPKITIFESLGLMILCSLLFKSGSSSSK